MSDDVAGLLAISMLANGVVGYLYYGARTKLRASTEAHEQNAATVARYQHIANLDAESMRLQNVSARTFGEARAASERLIALRERIRVLEGKDEELDYGLYTPHYDLPDASHYKQELKRVRDAQKALVKKRQSTYLATYSPPGANNKVMTAITKKTAKLMTRAFNSECDAAISGVSHRNIRSLEAKLQRSRAAIDKMGEALSLAIADAYFNLKLHELRLVHEHRTAAEEERAVERERRAQLRDDAKAQREFEQLVQEAEAAERERHAELEMARQRLAREQANSAESDALAAEIARLEEALTEAHAQSERALSMAQQTRAGHVYVISNFGCFGQNVFKIGMTRRLEPLDRIKELGGASVPFTFDVHAMIYSEDAPALEAELHREMDERRVNHVNRRREFFRATTGDLQSLLQKVTGRSVAFDPTFEAEEFRRSRALDREAGRVPDDAHQQPVSSPRPTQPRPQPPRALAQVTAPAEATAL